MYRLTLPMLVGAGLLALACGPAISAAPTGPAPELPPVAADAMEVPAMAVEVADLLATLGSEPPPLDAASCTGDMPQPGGRASFRAPLPRAPLYNPQGQKRVGLQAGHWLNEQRPPELMRLSPGSSGGGLQEWELNLRLAQETAALLERAGVAVDILPTTVPPGYRAHAFIAIHADGDAAGRLTGYKIARPSFSSIPEADDELVAALYSAYGPATGLQRDDHHISVRMLYYYAFNSRRYCHSVAPGVPQVIVETGFLTSASDRAVLIGESHRVAAGLAEGILSFLNR